MAFSIPKQNILNEILIEACQNGELDEVKELISQGANIDFIDDEDWQPITYAGANGYKEIVKYLIENGAELGHEDDLVLREALYNGYNDIVKLLIESGADIHSNESCCIKEASGNGDYDMVKYFIEQGADVNADFNCVITNASENGHVNVVKLLHQNGADLDKAIEHADDVIKEELINYKTVITEKALLKSDLHSVKPQAVASSRRI